MSGVYLLFVAAVWLALSVAIAYAITSRIKDAVLRVVVTLGLIALLLPLPLLDEIVGKPQFEQLCAQKSQVSIDASVTKGRTVWFGSSERTETQLSLLKVAQTKRSYVDVQTQEPVYHYFRLDTTGGWLSRRLGLSEGGSPLLFVGHCQPKDIGLTPSQLGVTLIRRETKN